MATFEGAFELSCDEDLALALSLQEEENRRFNQRNVKLQSSASDDFFNGKENKFGTAGSGSTKKCSLVDKSMELIDPTPNIFSLFREFDRQFFWGKLVAVELKWSPRMTRCAGVCSYEGRGGLCSVRLSKPLLELRPRKDLIETLLHEMIHAYLFVTANNDNHEEHGQEFHRHMHRINKIAGTNISVYHTFHDEVRHHLKHWWKCDGPCSRRAPYFGLVKRAMNRAPGPNDFWWSDHQRSCGGNFIKIKEPENYKKVGGKRKADDKTGDIRNFFTSSSNKRPLNTINNSNDTIENRKTGVHGFSSDTSVIRKGGTKSNSSSTVVVTGRGKKMRTSSSSSETTTNWSKVGHGQKLGGSISVPYYKRGNFDNTPANRPNTGIFGMSQQSQSNVQRESDSLNCASNVKKKSNASKNGSSGVRSFVSSAVEAVGQFDRRSFICAAEGSNFFNNLNDSARVEYNRVQCPCCFNYVLEIDINAHIDVCLNVCDNSSSSKCSNKPSAVIKKELDSADHQEKRERDTADFFSNNFLSSSIKKEPNIEDSGTGNSINAVIKKEPQPEYTSSISNNCASTSVKKELNCDTEMANNYPVQSAPVVSRLVKSEGLDDSSDMFSAEEDFDDVCVVFETSGVRVLSNGVITIDSEEEDEE